MDGVPLRTPAAVQEVQQDVTVTVPDYLTTLQDTQYEFSLEKWVLTGLQSVSSSQPQSQAPTSPSGLLPSCPPYWMMLSASQRSGLVSCHSSELRESSPPRRSHSLSPTAPRSKRAVSASAGEGESSAHSGCSGDEGQLGQRKTRRAFVPDLLNPPTCLSSLPHQRRKNLRHRSLSVCHMSSQHDGSTEQLSHSSRASSHHRPLTTSNGTAHMIPIRPGGEGSAAAPAPRDLHSSGLDSTAELLSALSPEERELLEAVTARGYPLHMAILALQRTGHQSPDKVWSYLVACDHLCQLGYSMAQVEEALEMFQNCETKAEEFLQLLSQFNEMGFQQSTIKEVLLVHENHRDRALEELMTRVA